MNTNKILLSALAGGVAYFFLGWVVYGMLLGDVFMTPSESTKEPMVMWAMAVSCLFYGLLFAVIFGRWAGISTFKSGFMAGGVIGAIISLSMNLSMFSMSNSVTLEMVGIDFVVAGILAGITGGIVGWVLGYSKS